MPIDRRRDGSVEDSGSRLEASVSRGESRLEGSGEVPVLRGKGREVDHIDVEMPMVSLYSLSSSQSSTAERPPSPSSKLLPAAVSSFQFAELPRRGLTCPVVMTE